MSIKTKAEEFRQVVEKQKKQRQTTDSDCTFYSVWQVAALSNFWNCEKKKESKVIKKGRRRISTASFFFFKRVKACLQWLSFALRLRQTTPSRHVSNVCLCFFACQEHQGPYVHTLVSSCQASSVKTHRKDFAITCWPPQKNCARSHWRKKTRLLQDTYSVLLSVFLLYIQKSQKSAVDWPTDLIGGGEGVGGIFTERFKCYKTFHKNTSWAVCWSSTMVVLEENHKHDGRVSLRLL